MSAAKPPHNESERLQALRKTGLLDSAPEERFDRITRLASQFFRVQTCLVSLVDSERQWFKSRVGLDDVEQTHRDHSFCAHAILGNGILVVPDARLDPRFADNPLVTGPPHIRFYAGAPLVTRSGYRLGSLCLIDPQPRQLSLPQLKALRDFADCIEEEIDNARQAELQRKLNASMVRSNSMLRTLPDMVFVVNREHIFVVCNEHPDLLLPAQQILGRSIREVLPEELAQPLEDLVSQAFASGELLSHEHSINQGQLHYEARLQQLDRREVLIVIRNITEHKQDAERLQSSEALLRAVVDANSIGTWKLNLQTEEMFVNDKWASLLGYRLEELGQITYDTWKHRVHPDDLTYCLDLINQHARGEIPFYEASLRMQHKDGRWVWITTRGRINSFTPDGQPEMMLGTHFDISTQVYTENSLQEQSQHMQVIVDHMIDGIITIDGKGNLQSFNPAAEQIFGYQSAEVLGKNVKMLMPEPHRSHHDVYIQNYLGKGLGGIIGKDRELEGLHRNGHLFPVEVGIAEVKQGGERLNQAVRQGDTIARLGGDEFVVMLENLAIDSHDAANQAEVVAEKLLTELSRRFDLDGLEYHSSTSIGITLFNDQSHSREDLLKQADMAMYKAKAAGRNGIRFFDPQMQVAVTARAALEQDMHEAIRQQQFCLHYQPQVDQYGHIFGAEVLLRWEHPTRGMVSPANFIPLAEETGLILQIGDWALQQACQTLADWAKNPATAELTLAVNISVVQFRRSDLVGNLLRALERTGADPNKLKLEITESLLANNLDEVVDKMSALRQLGVSFSIDDFGTGYSSLFYLKQLPINQLKIDQSFVREILHNSNDQAIAEAIITMAKAMQLYVIAEGVETEAQLNRLLFTASQRPFSVPTLNQTLV